MNDDRHQSEYYDHFHIHVWRRDPDNVESRSNCDSSNCVSEFNLRTASSPDTLSDPPTFKRRKWVFPRWFVSFWHYRYPGTKFYFFYGTDFFLFMIYLIFRVCEYKNCGPRCEHTFIKKNKKSSKHAKFLEM